MYANLRLFVCSPSVFYVDLISFTYEIKCSDKCKEFCVFHTQLVYYSCKLNFFHFELETANQSGFETGSLGHKAAMLTIELHSIDILKLFKKFA